MASIEKRNQRASIDKTNLAVDVGLDAKRLEALRANLHQAANAIHAVAVAVCHAENEHAHARYERDGRECA